MQSIIEDVRYIDDSITNFTADTSSYTAAATSNRKYSLSKNTRELDTRSKEIEAIIIKSFFKSILPVRKVTNRRRSHGNMPITSSDHLSKAEEEQLSMKLVQILINNYPEIMRIPDELITNVNHKLTTSKSSGSLKHFQNSTGFL